MKIGLFYGSTTCYTEIAAEKIQAVIGGDLVELHNIKEVALADCLDYDFIIFGLFGSKKLNFNWKKNHLKYFYMEIK